MRLKADFMTEDHTSEFTTQRLLKQYIEQCDEFGPPDLDAFLEDVVDLEPRGEFDLLLIDQSCRWLSGDNAPVEVYLQRFPDLLSDESMRLELIIAEYHLLEQIGRKPDVDEYQTRFPHLAARIAEALSGDDTTPASINKSRIIRDVLSNVDMGSSVSIRRTNDLNDLTGFDPTGSFVSATGGDPTKIEAVLPRCDLFNSLPPHVIHLLEMYMEPVDFSTGEYLMRQGETGDALLLLCEGSVEISTLIDGERHIITKTSRVQVLGEMALLTAEPRSADVKAIAPTKVLVLPAARFHEVAVQHPQVSQVLTMLLATRLGRPDREDVLAGKLLDQYLIKRRLGRGGMSVVYAAQHSETGERVALKMMSHRLVYDQAALQQFQREADIVESFEHANIVRMYGRFKAFHTFFIVMQYCDGETLSRMIRRVGPFPETLFRKVVGQMAAALQHAHQAGVVHQDVKPSNIMIGRDGTVQLMDFGLAKSTDEDMLNSDPIVGTPRYMAPEQAKGANPTPQTDYFAFGCVAYEMMTGKPLFPDNTIGGMLKRVRSWEPPDTTTMRPEYGEDIHRFLKAALRVQPADRLVNLPQLIANAGTVGEEMDTGPKPEE